ncbi:RCC1/BLIP-II protein [Linnemannia elongata AG-77]|uniref:RCC1/BLIP-II protein n=1 Tax=Linnemannia elongata AG-77 TaxID=1314771 RepID=A0A197K6I1_9FUNG|nr:RCC1/BLIP-II protein [Linnemannia elongata AG-77]
MRPRGHRPAKSGRTRPLSGFLPNADNQFDTSICRARTGAQEIEQNETTQDKDTTLSTIEDLDDPPLSSLSSLGPTSSLSTWFEPTTSDSTTLQQRRQQRRKPTDIFQLPFEILVGQILVILQLSDLARLALVSKAMQQLCQADYLWQRKFFHDFHHRPNRTLKQLGSWKRIYQAMDRVEVYTWGSNSDCRLGYGRTPKKFYESVPKRIRKLDGAGILELAPTGWGCHALDKNGNVWAWGRIMETNAIRSDAMPRMLKRPRNVVQIAAGRQVVLAVDASGRLWQWCRENKAVEVTLAPQTQQHYPASLLSTTGIPEGLAASLTEERDHDPVEQITAGWDICAALTRSGKIYAWRPPLTADGRYQHRVYVEHSVQLKEQGPDGYEASTMDGDKFVGIAAGTDYVVAVTSMEKVYVFRRLDSPHYNHANAILSTLATPRGASHNHQHHQHHHRASRHHYHHHHHSHNHHHHHHHNNNHMDASGQLQNYMEFEDRIVFEPEVEGCKQERVLEIKGRLLGVGLYLPIFSEALSHTVTETYEEHDQWERRQRHHRRQSWHPSTVSTDTALTSKSNGNLQQQLSSMPPLPAHSTSSPLITSSFSRPTTLSANFQNFALHHSSGKVLLGKHDVQSDTCPIVLDRLLTNACQVEFGDHHQGLLTEDGQLRTWGAFCEGALGHGDLRAGCAIPTVVEGPLKNRFVIKVGMGGWQSACLAIDMSEDRTFGGGAAATPPECTEQLDLSINNSIRKVPEESHIHTLHLPSLQLLPHPRPHGRSLQHLTWRYPHTAQHPVHSSSAPTVTVKEVLPPTTTLMVGEPLHTHASHPSGSEATHSPRSIAILLRQVQDIV